MKIFLILLSITVSSFAYSNSSVLFLNRILNYNENMIGKNYERLSRGTIRIQDDPANYVIYEKIEDQIREMDKTIANENDMLSYYNYMDAILSGINDSLQRVRELLIKKENIIYSDSEREVIDNEIKQCYEDVVYDLEQAEFNKVKVFSEILAGNEFKNYFDSNKYFDINNVDKLFNFIITQRGTIGAVCTRLENRINGEALYKENSVRFKSQGDIDYATEVSILKKNTVLMMANILLLTK
jgi:flagellin-like hook-associated protein FlgL